MDLESNMLQRWALLQPGLTNELVNIMSKKYILDENYKYFGFWTLFLSDENWETFSRNCPLPPDYAFQKIGKDGRNKQIYLLWKSHENISEVWGRVDYRCSDWMTSKESTIPPLHILFDYFSQLNCMRRSQPMLVSWTPSSLDDQCDVPPINLDYFRYQTASSVGVEVYKLKKPNFQHCDYRELSQFPYDENGLFHKYCINSYRRHHRLTEMIKDQASFDMWYPLFCAECEKAWFWRKFFADDAKMMELVYQVEKFATQTAGEWFEKSTYKLAYYHQ